MDREEINMLDIFHFEDSKASFNDISYENGFTYWLASDLMKALGYQSFNSFKSSINKAVGACQALNIPIMENFQQIGQYDYKLSRFACYLVAMNSDPKKHNVALAQAYFAATAEAFRKYIQESEDVERILIRDEISGHEKQLSSTANSAGVKNYALFQNAGYRGMYNMNLKKLKSIKDVPETRSPLDFMGKEELAANLFRITQTEAKIKNENIYGQRNAEMAAEGVGRKVRETMMEISGTRPEALPIRDDIKKVKSAIKASHKDFKKLDNKRKKELA